MNVEIVDAALTIGSAKKIWVGRGLSGLVIVFLLMDSVMKLLAVPAVLEAGQSIGFPGASMNRGLGLLLLACTALYIVAGTSVLGAILITAFLGGAVATHVRLGNPLFSHVLFGVYVGLLTWAGLVLRHPKLLSLIPVVRGI
jgi:hypothetical protein